MMKFGFKVFPPSSMASLFNKKVILKYIVQVSSPSIDQPKVKLSETCGNEMQTCDGYIDFLFPIHIKLNKILISSILSQMAHIFSKHACSAEIVVDLFLKNIVKHLRVSSYIASDRDSRVNSKVKFFALNHLLCCIFHLINTRSSTNHTSNSKNQEAPWHQTSNPKP